MEINAFLKFEIPGGPRSLGVPAPCLGLKADWEDYDSEKPGHLLMARDAGSDNMVGLRPVLGPSPHPGAQ